jgi:hypothetical protein
LSIWRGLGTPTRSARHRHLTGASLPEAERADDAPDG